MWQERPCGLLCEGRCCRWEEDLCSAETGGLQSELQSAAYHPGDLDGCAEKCALENYEGMKYVPGDDNCYCISEIGTFDPSIDWVSSCKFANV